MTAAPSMIGRERELGALIALLRSEPILTVTGPGGVGKTRLLDEAVALVGPTVAVRHLLAEARAHGGGIERVTWADLLADVADDDLLVIDVDDLRAAVSAAHLAALMDALARRARSRRPIRIVAASRSPLGLSGEHVLVVAPLSCESSGGQSSPAVEMLRDRARAHGATWPTDAGADPVAEALCRTVDGLPLALEILAGHSATLDPGLLLAEPAALLDRVALDASERPVRHHSMRACIDSAVECLAVDDQRLLREASALAQPFDLDLLAALTGIGWIELTERVRGLLDRSLLTLDPHGPRLGLRISSLTALRLAQALTVSGERAEIESRVLDVVEASATGRRAMRLAAHAAQRSASPALVANLVAATEAAIRGDDAPDRAITLYLGVPQALDGGDGRIGRHVGAALFQRWPDASGERWHEALAAFAEANALCGDSAAAVTAAQRVLLADQVTWVGRAVAHRALMFAAVQAGDLTLARRHAEGAHDEAADGDAWMLARMMRVIGAALALRSGDVNTGRTIIDEAIGSSARIGDAAAEYVALSVHASLPLDRATRDRGAIRREELRDELDDCPALGVVLALLDGVGHPCGVASASVGLESGEGQVHAKAVEGLWRRDGDGWEVGWGTRSTRLGDRKGMHDIALLLARPGEEIAAITLMRGLRVSGDAGEVVDRPAMRAYQNRIIDVQRELHDAFVTHDIHRAHDIERELNHLVQQLATAGLAGRPRATGASMERARSAITRRVRAALDAVAQVQPALAGHLSASISTGAWCAYRPDRPVAWTLHDGSGSGDHHA